MKTFVCDMCGKEEEEGPEEVAEAELAKYFPGESKEECAVVCDDCWQKIRPENNPLEYTDYLREIGK